MKNIQNNNGKNKKTKKKVQTHGQGLGRGLAGDMGLNFFFLGFSMVFCSLAKTSRTEHKKNQKNSPDPWARSGLSTHKPKNQKTKKPRNQKTKKPKNQKTKKPKNQKTKKTKKTKKTRPNTLHLTPSPWGVQSWFFCFFWFFGFLFFWFLGFLVFWFFGLCVDSPDLAHGSELFVFFLFFLCSRGFGQTAKNHGKTKKTKNQETKKPKKQKNQKKTKNQDCTPQGEGVRCRVLGLVFLFFLFFFWFFGFLVWIAIADVPSRDCQALSVVALEARSIHYSTAMFAMT